jgi:hypothetical protein
MKLYASPIYSKVSWRGRFMPVGALWNCINIQNPTNLGLPHVRDYRRWDSTNLDSVAVTFLSVIPAGNLLLVSGTYEKQIPCGNDRKKSKGAAAIKSIDL